MNLTDFVKVFFCQYFLLYGYYGSALASVIESDCDM